MYVAGVLALLRVYNGNTLFDSMPDKPFVFVINFQMPGDPPVTLLMLYSLWFMYHNGE